MHSASAPEHRPPLVSYAQNNEDVILARAFTGRSGFYVDVGAGHPVHESVTKLFYDRGWRGINVEPNETSFRALIEERPRDVNLRVGLGARPGSRVFYQSTSHPGASTFAKAVIDSVQTSDLEVHEVEVPLATLAEVCEQHVAGEIDFLKVDVEAMEHEVLLGGDWRRWRPRVVVVEATVPYTSLPSHAAWEPILLRHRYLFALFDGINRFYVRGEDRALLDVLRVPVNVLDQFVPYRTSKAIHGLRHEIEAKDRALQEAKEYVRRLEARIAELEGREEAPAGVSGRPAGGASGEAGPPYEAAVALEPAPLSRLPKVTAVIVHHRGYDLLERCLRALAASRGVHLRAVVVANACDEEIPAVDSTGLELHVVSSERPLGFSAANNLAIEWTRGHLPPSDYYFFLNNDTQVAPDALEVLARDLDRRPGWAIAGPCLRILGADDHLNSLGLNVSGLAEAWDEGIGRTLAEYGPLPGQREVLAVTGSALLIRSEVFHEIGGWTELYGYYLEDIDLCLKARSRGWGVVNDPEASVLHVLSATATSDFKTLLTWRNRILLMVIRWPWRLLGRTFPQLVAREAALYARRRLVRAKDDARLQARAWREALRLLPRALAVRRRTSGKDSRWVDLLSTPGTVPVIRLPEIRPAEATAGAAGGLRE